MIDDVHIQACIQSKAFWLPLSGHAYPVTSTGHLHVHYSCWCTVMEESALANSPSSPQEAVPCMSTASRVLIVDS